MLESNLPEQTHVLHTFTSPYMLPTPLAELLCEQDGQTVVLVTGVFDVLHQEHIHFLENAKEIGTLLVVALESDSRVRQLKGPTRPHFSQNKRRQNLLDLDIATIVVILPEEFSLPEQHEAVISQIQPHFLAVSSHTQHQDKKEKILAKYGGEVVVVHEQNAMESSSQVLGE